MPRIRLVQAALALCAFAISANIGVARAADPVPYLRVETGVHGSAINQAIVLPGGATIATVSDDKTARLWAADTLRPLGVVRPALGPSDDSALYAVAASGNVLAIGGRIRDGERFYKVAFYRLPDLKPIGQRGQLPAPVSALKFSRDGHTLIVGMIAGAGLGFYDLRTGVLDHPDTAYAGEVQWIDVDAAGRTVVSGEDGGIRLYGPDHRKLGDAKLTGGAKPFGVAFSPDGKFIAAGSQNSARVDLLDGAMRPVRGFAGAAGRAGGFGVVAFAADGQSLVGAGTYKSASGLTRLARRWSVDGKTASEMELGTDTVTAVLPVGDGLVVTDGLPMIERLDPSGRVAAAQRSRGIDFRDAGLTGFAVSADGAAVSLPGAATVFDAKGRAIVTPAAAPALARPVDHAGSMQASGWRNGVTPALNGRPVRLERDERALAAAVSTAAGGAAFGTNFFVHFERPDGREWHVVVPAPAYAVNISGDGNWVVAGLGDGTVRWYDATDGHEALDLFVAPATRHWVLSTPDGFFDHDNAAGGQPDGRDLIGYGVNDPEGQVARFVEMGQLYPKFYRPDLVGLALRRDAPARQVVQAAEQRQAPVANVLKQGLPPTIELVDLCGGPSAGPSPGCPGARELDQAKPPDHPGAALATRAERLLIRYRVSDPSGTLPAEALGGARVTRNGAVTAASAITVSRDPHSRTDEVVMALGEGANAIQIRPVSAAGDIEGSAAAAVNLTVWRAPSAVAAATEQAGGAPPPAHRATLHLLSVGVSKYVHSELALDNAASDAHAVMALMNTPDPHLYDRVEAVELLDSQATAANVTRALRNIADNARPDDLVVIFLAGHGGEVDGQYYFAPVDLGTADPNLFRQALKDGGPMVDQLFRSEGMGPKSILPFIQSTKAAHVALILDTCYSGSLATQDAVMRSNVNTTVTNSLGNALGRFVLSSATALAWDSADTTPGQDGHGLFTSFLLSALEGKADLLRTGRVDVVQLANYTIANVVRSSARSTQKQQPTFFFNGSDFFALRTY